jgi:hypothetical protein
MIWTKLKSDGLLNHILVAILNVLQHVFHFWDEFFATSWWIKSEVRRSGDDLDKRATDESPLGYSENGRCVVCYCPQ